MEVLETTRRGTTHLVATMSRSPLKEELIVQLRRTIPVSLSHLMRRSLDVMSVAVLGHIGKDVLAAGALAQSTVNTAALSVLVGLSSATVTLTSQAVGAGDRLQTGLWLHRAIVVSFLTALPITVLLSFFLRPSSKRSAKSPSLPTLRAAIARGYCPAFGRGPSLGRSIRGSRLTALSSRQCIARSLSRAYTHSYSLYSYTVCHLVLTARQWPARSH